MGGGRSPLETVGGTMHKGGDRHGFLWEPKGRLLKGKIPPMFGTGGWRTLSNHGI